MKEIEVRTRDGAYSIFLARGVLCQAGELLRLNRRCMIVTDRNIPELYVRILKNQCYDPYVFTIEPGEDSKCLSVMEEILGEMLAEGFDRTDCVIALGGGVVGDLAGFAASVYQRGIDFYNIPTTVLSQVDSSIGGKVAVNFRGLKNMLGAFYPPKAVLVDVELLASLPPRQIANGLAESVKMGVSLDGELFQLMERFDPMEHIEEIVELSLRVKKMVVEKDEREAGLRKVLNFGHTLAHAVESASMHSDYPYFHGECVAMGMKPMCSGEVWERLEPVLKKLGLPTEIPFSAEVLLEALSHDKKMQGDAITLIRSDFVGTYRMEKVSLEDFKSELRGLLP